MPTVFVIGLRHQPGELANFASVLASRDINVDTLAGLVHGDHAIVTFVPDDAEATRALLEEHNAPYEVYEGVVVDIPNRPGELAKVAKRLGDAGANITSIMPLPAEDGDRLVLTFEDPDQARDVLAASD